MPFQSQAQRRLFFAKAAGAGYAKGPSQSVAQKFIRDSGETPPHAKLQRRLEDAIREPRKHTR